MKNAVVIYSGGLDSTVLLYYVIKELKMNPVALSFIYGQKHAKEVYYASRVAAKLKVPHKTINISSMGFLFSRSALVGSEQEIPKEPYDKNSLKATIVPNRNMILISLATAFALSNDIKDLYYGAHSGDHEVYPDCRPEFVDAVRIVLALCDFHPVALQAPFLFLDKATIVKAGAGMEVPFKDTWSCYEGLTIHCGVCSTCRERKRAFREAKVNDLTEYKE